MYALTDVHDIGVPVCYLTREQLAWLALHWASRKSSYHLGVVPAGPHGGKYVQGISIQIRTNTACVFLTNTRGMLGTSRAGHLSLVPGCIRNVEGKDTCLRREGFCLLYLYMRGASLTGEMAGCPICLILIIHVCCTVHEKPQEIYTTSKQIRRCHLHVFDSFHMMSRSKNCPFVHIISKGILIDVM